MESLMELLDATQARHRHLCPRQVLGVRIGLAGFSWLNIDPALPRKSLLVIAETDGCFVEGLQVTTKVSVGHRTLRIEDYGKVAATFVHLQSGQAVRLFPKPGLQELARKYGRDGQKAYFVQLIAYQIIPDEELLVVEPVVLTQSLKEIRGVPGKRLLCSRCGEEIINGREAWAGETPACVACAGLAYYHSVEEMPHLEQV